MATQQPNQCITLPAAADYSAKQYYLMAYNASGRAVLASTAGQFCIGVLQDDPAAAGRAGQVATSGLSKVIYGGGVTIGDPLTTDASGKAVTATKSTDWVIGTAWVTGVSGDIGAVDMTTKRGYFQVITYGEVGTIQLPLSSARELLTDATMNAAANGGLLASDSTPILEAVNGATDPKWRLNWASSNSDKIAWDVPLPDDLDGTRAMTVKLFAGMAGATNTPTIAVTAWFGVGDVNCGGTTAALAAAAAEVSVTIAAADVPDTTTGNITLVVVPGAHTTDALYLYGAKVSYYRR